MKTENLILLGAVGIALYFYLKKSGIIDSIGGGGGGGGTPTTPGPTIPDGFTNWTEYHNASPDRVSRSSWISAEYSAPGQPSSIFARNTLIEAGRIMTAQPNARVRTISQQQTINAASAIVAGAPPRIVAKIKAGKVY